MKNVGDLFVFFIILLTVAGWVVAKGFWSTLFALCIPPYAWYLTVEHFLTVFKLL